MVRPNRQFEGGSPIVVFASAARAAAEVFTSEVYDGALAKARGALFVIEVTDGGGDGVDVTFTIQKWNPSTNVWATALASAADVDAAEVRNLIVHPDMPAVANLSAAANLSPKWRVIADHDHAETITYEVLAFPLI
jgi:hypothetical protein